MPRFPASPSRSSSRFAVAVVTRRTRQARPLHDRDRRARPHHPRSRRRLRPAPGRGVFVDPGAGAPPAPTRRRTRPAAPRIARTCSPARVLRPSGHVVRVVHTTEYSFHYEGERRIMWQDAVGDPWSAEQAAQPPATRPGSTSARSHAPTSAGDAGSAGEGRPAAPRRPAGSRPHGDHRTSSRRTRIGDAGATSRCSSSTTRRQTLVGSADPEKLRALGVREAILTVGSKGAWVVTRELVEHVPAVPGR